MVFVLLTFVGRTYADNLAVDQVTIRKGGTMKVGIVLNNPTIQYVAFQFDLMLPADVDVMQAVLNSVRKQKHQLLCNKVGEGHYCVVALSTSNNEFSGTSGELLNIVLDGYDTDGIVVDNIHFVTPQGTDVPFEAIGVSKDRTTTAVNSIHNVESNKHNVYNLNGQCITAPQKGLNIIDGKKVVIK